MTVDPALLQEAVRRGLVPPPAEPTAEPSSVDPALLAEARKRGLIPGEPEPSMLSRAGSAIVDTAKSVGQGAVDMVTGASRRELDLPELPDVYTPQGMSGRLMSIGRDDLRKFDILRTATGQEIPGSIDKFGNVIVTIDQSTADALNSARPPAPDTTKLFSPRDATVPPAYWNRDIPQVQPGQYYLNRPGASMQDAQDTTTAAVVEAAPAALGGGLPALWGIFGAAGGAAAGSGAQDLLAKAAGSRQDPGTGGVDIGAMALNAGVGGGAEAMTRMLFPFLKRVFTSGGYTPEKGFTPDATAALRNLGINADDLTPEWRSKFAELARQNVDMEGAAKLADADTLPVPVPLSKGDITRVVSDQSFESSAGKGSLGKDAYDIMENFRGQQQAALKANADAITAKLGTGEAIPPLSGFSNVQGRLAQEATGTYQQAGKLYDEATKMGARVDAAGVRTFAENAKRALAGQFGREDQKAAMSLLDELSADLSGASGVTVTKTTVKRLEEFRGALERQARAAGRDPSGVVLRRVKDDFDDFLDGAVENGLVSGEMEAIDKIKEARGLWRTLKQKYDNNGIVGALIEFDPGTKTYVPKVEPEAAARTLFTGTGAGFKKGAEKAAGALKATLGEDSPEWLQLKQEGVMRLLLSQETGNVRDAAGNLTFSGDKFSTQFRRAMRESEGLMRTLYTPEEISMLRQFERVALRATNRRTGAVNYSNSAETLLKVLDGFGGQVPGAGFILSPVKKFLQGAGEYEAARQAKAATERGVAGAVSQARQLPAAARGLGGAAGVAATTALPDTEKRRPTLP